MPSADNEIVREAIQTNRDKMFYVSVFIAVHADSVEELNKKCDSVEDVLAQQSGPRLFLDVSPA